MGLLKASFDGVVIPVEITKVNRNLTPPINNNKQNDRQP